jgi:hypothetical protein
VVLDSAATNVRQGDRVAASMVGNAAFPETLSAATELGAGSVPFTMPSSTEGRA